MDELSGRRTLSQQPLTNSIKPRHSVADNQSGQPVPPVHLAVPYPETAHCVMTDVSSENDDASSVSAFGGVRDGKQIPRVQRPSTAAGIGGEQLSDGAQRQGEGAARTSDADGQDAAGLRAVERGGRGGCPPTGAVDSASSPRLEDAEAERLRVRLAAANSLAETLAFSIADYLTEKKAWVLVQALAEYHRSVSHDR